MSDRGETNNHHPPMPELARLCAEHAALGLAAISLTAMIVALIVEEWTAVIVFRGMYSALAGTFVAGCAGWIVGSAERRVRHDLGRAVAGLTKEIADLREQVQRQTRHLPARARRQARHMYASPPVEGESAVGGIDPMTIAAARRISQRLRAVDGE